MPICRLERTPFAVAVGRMTIGSRFAVVSLAVGLHCLRLVTTLSQGNTVYSDPWACTPNFFSCARASKTVFLILWGEGGVLRRCYDG